MEIILRKEILDAMLEKRINGLNFDPNRTEFVKQHVITDEIFNFFSIGINETTIKALFERIGALKIDNLTDIPAFVTLMTTKDVLEAVIKALSIIKNTPIPRDENELINLLIDFKTIENPEFFEKILSDILEDAVNEKK